MTVPSRLAGLLALLALAACGRSEGAAPDANFLVAEGADPALTAVLEDQFLTDPNLVQQAHPNTVRPPEAPVQAQYPPGSANRDLSAAAAPAHALCGADFDRGSQWASRMPPEFPLYPRAYLLEAAGNDSGGCRMRVVAFRTVDGHQRVLDHYRALAERAGFDPGYQQRGADHVLGGVNPRTDDAFVLVVTPSERGAEAALIVSRAG